MSKLGRQIRDAVIFGHKSDALRSDSERLAGAAALNRFGDSWKSGSAYDVVPKPTQGGKHYEA